MCALRGVGVSYPKHKPSDPYCRTHLPTGWKLSGGHAGKTRARDGKDLKRGELALDITNSHTLSHSLPFKSGASFLCFNSLQPGSLSTAKFDKKISSIPAMHGIPSNNQRHILEETLSLTVCFTGTASSLSLSLKLSRSSVKC